MPDTPRARRPHRRGNRIIRSGATHPSGPAGCPVRLLVLLAAATALVPACSGEPGPHRVPATEGGGREETLLATEDERAGEGVYRAENCARCHTLFDRPGEDARPVLPPSPLPETTGAGSRVGPDLGLEGHRHSDEWHYAHLYAPGAVVRGSRMPASRHLFRPSGGLPSPTPDARRLVAYLQALGRGRRDIWAEWRGREVEVPHPPASDGALADRGRELYRRHCASCHGEAGDGRGEAAGFFTIAPRDLAAASFRFRSTPLAQPPADADLFRTITLGSGTGAAMPSFYWLGERDRWALVLAVKGFSPALNGTGLAAVPGDAEEDRPGAVGQPDAARLEAGRRLWDGLGCATCHANDAAGIPGSAPDLTHACALRAGASPEALDRSIRWGIGTAMPSYADAVPDASSRRLLIDYVRTLVEAGPSIRPDREPTSRRTPDRP